MTSIATCIKKAGKALNKQDADAIREIVATGGVGVGAIDEHLEALNEELESLVAEINAAGGDLVKSKPLFSRRADDVVPDNPEGRPSAPASEPDQGIPHNLSQNAKYDVALAMAEENKALMDPILERISNRMGISMTSDIKSRESSIGKANRPNIIRDKNRPWWNVEYLKDIFRFNAELENYEHMPAVLEMLSQEMQAAGGMVIIKMDTEKVLAPGLFGWRPIAVDIQMPNGQVAEFYAAPKELIRDLRGSGHNLFERWRFRDVDELNRREARRWKKDEAASTALYTAAFNEYLARSGQTESDVLASLNNLLASASSITATKSAAKSAKVKPGDLVDQAPSSSRNAMSSSSMMTTRESSLPIDTDDISGSPFDNIVPLYSRQPQDKLGFFSGLSRAAQSLKQAKGNPKQILAAMRNFGGVKEEEIEWTGLAEFLEAKGDTVTKDELTAFLNNEGVQVVEVQKGGNAQEQHDEKIGDAFNAAGYGITPTDYDEGFTYERFYEATLEHEPYTESVEFDDLPQNLQDLINEEPEYSPPKYEQYTLEGGKNYREILLTLPAEERPVPWHEARQKTIEKWPGADGETYGDLSLAKQAIFDKMFGDEETWRRRQKTDSEGKRGYSGRIRAPESNIDSILVDISAAGLEGVDYGANEDHSEIEFSGLSPIEYQTFLQISESNFGTMTSMSKGSKPVKDFYRTAHWGEPNIIAHLRLNDRVGPNGERVLFIEELQSDWHQAGRKYGYTGTNKIKAADLTFINIEEVTKNNEKPKYWFELPAGETNVIGDSRVPGWGATEEEARQGAWNTVYGSPISQSGFVPNAPFKGNAWVELGMKRVLRMAAEGGYAQVAWTTGEQQADRYSLSKQVSEILYNPKTDHLIAYTHGMAIESDRTVINKTVRPAELENYIGKELANKLLEEEAKPYKTKGRVWTGVPVHLLAGNDLEVGGEGMKSFYNRTLPNVMRKIARKLDKGSMVAPTKIETRAAKWLTMRAEQEQPAGNWGVAFNHSGFPHPSNVGWSLDFTAGGTQGRGWDTREEAQAWIDKELKRRAVIDAASTPEVWGIAVTAGMREQVLDEGQSLFSRAPEKGTSETAVKAAQLRLVLAPAIRSLVGKVQVNIVETTADLPGKAVPSDVEGLWYQGTDEVYLVAENLPDVLRAKKVMAHEVLGHLAMEDQPEFKQILDAIRNLKGMGNVAIVKAAAQVAATQGTLDSVTESKEILAVMIENGVQSGTVNRAIAATRQLLRRIGLNLEYTEGEIRELAVRAARSLHTEAAAKRAALANMSVQQQLLADPRTVEQAVYAAIREVYASTVLQDMTMTLHAELNAISKSDDPVQKERSAEIRKVLYRGGMGVPDAPDAIDTSALYSRVYRRRRKSNEISWQVAPEIEAHPLVQEVEVFSQPTGYYVHAQAGYWFESNQSNNKIFESLVEFKADRIIKIPESAGPLWANRHPKSRNILMSRAAGPTKPMTMNRRQFLSGLAAAATTAAIPSLPAEIAKVLKIGKQPLSIDGYWGSKDVGEYYDWLRSWQSALGRGDIKGAKDYLTYAIREAVHLAETYGWEATLPDAWVVEQAAAKIAEFKRTRLGRETESVFEIGQRFGIQQEISDDGRRYNTESKKISDRALYSRAINANPEIERLIGTKMATPIEDITARDRLRMMVQRVRGMDWLSVKQGLIDSAASVEALEKNLFGHVLDASQSGYKAMLATKNLGSVMAAVMHVGVPMERSGVFSPVSGREGLLEIVQPIAHHADGNLLAQWELYIAAFRAQRLILERNPDGTSKEKNFTQAEINTALSLAVEYPEFEVARQKWQVFNSQVLDFAIKQGVINGDEAAIWRKNDYVPFYRAMEEVEYSGGQGPNVGRGGIANVRSGIKRLTGSEKPLGNVFENMVMNTAYLIDAGYRNNAMRRVAGMAEGIAMNQIPMAWEAVIINDGMMARALMKAGLIVGRGVGNDVGQWTPEQIEQDAIRQVQKMTKDQKEHWSKVFRRVAPKGDDVVSVLVNGKPVYYEVTDPLLLRAIGAMGAKQYGGVMNLFRVAKRTLTGAVTIDPAFMMANFIRDTLSTWVVADHGKAPPFLSAIRGAAAAWKQDPDMLALMMAGAGGGGFYDHNPADVRKMLAKRMPKNNVNSFMNSVLTPRGLWRFWQKVGNASEQANRIAVYRRVIAEGGTVAEAAYQARDVLNFTMSGDYEAMKFIVQTVPFLNARVQGLYRLARGAAEHPGSFAMKGLMITAATLALLVKNEDDDRYNELPEWDKDTYWHFFIGDEHFRLPKPFEVGALFATIPERAMRVGQGDEDLELFYDRMKRMMLDTFAFNPIPQLLKPMQEQYSNRNMFTGSPIIGLAQEGLQPEAQYDPWTSTFMVDVADAMPDFAPDWLRSPKRLEAATRGYFGSVGMYALSVGDAVTRRAMGHPAPPTKAIQDYPVITRFWRNPEARSSKYSSDLYDMMHEADALHKTMKAYRDQGRIEEYQALRADGEGKLRARKRLHAIAAKMSKLNKSSKLVQYSDRTADEKKALLDEINQRKLKILRQVASVSDLF